MEHKQSKVRIKEIIRAFKHDCFDLLCQFSNTDGKTYEDFVKLWLKGGYNLCLVLHKSLEKIRIFNALTLEIGKELLFAKTEEYSNLGAFYLLYLLFDRQFKRCGNHIKLTHKEYSLFSNIVVDLVQKGHEEVRFIYNILENNLFFMVNYDNPLGYDLVSDHMINRDAEENDVTNETLLKFFDESYSKYKETKDNLSKMIDGPHEVLDVIQRSCNVIDTKFEKVKEFLRAPDYVQEFKPILKEKTNDKVSKKSIKDKAMKLKNEPKSTSRWFSSETVLVPELPKRKWKKNKKRCMGYIFEEHEELEEQERKENEAKMLAAQSEVESKIDVKKKSMPVLEDVIVIDNSEIDENRTEMMEVCDIKSEFN